MKLQDIINGQMLPGSDDLRCGNCIHYQPAQDGTRTGRCRYQNQSLFYDDWVCIRWESKNPEI